MADPQNGPTFFGSMQFPGYGGGTLMVSGTVAGHTGIFTMMPAGSVMNGSCSEGTTGTLDMDELRTQMHGTYVGSEYVRRSVRARTDVHVTRR